MRLQGKISEWNDARGFGFVQPHGGGERCFVHIRAFSARDRRPALGDVITYDVQTDAQGRRNATAVRFALARDGARPRAHAGGRAAARGAGPDRLPRTAIALVFLAGITAVAMWQRWPSWVPGIYLALSVVTFAWYWHDKSAAQHDRQRTPESTLQGLALLGGWPGALMAQAMLRHKNRKASFQQVFWTTVAINLVALGWLIHDGSLLG